MTEKVVYQWLKKEAVSDQQRHMIARWAQEVAQAWLAAGGREMSPPQTAEGIKLIFAAVSELYGLE